MIFLWYSQNIVDIFSQYYIQLEHKFTKLFAKYCNILSTAIEDLSISHSILCSPWLVLLKTISANCKTRFAANIIYHLHGWRGEGGAGGLSLCRLPKSERVQSEAFAKSNIKYLFAMHAFVCHFIYYTYRR